MSLNDSLVEDVIKMVVNKPTFGWTDYTFFMGMLGVSTVVGIYFGFFAKKQETTDEYLLGGKTLGYVPVAMSLTASHLSGNTLLGIPAEVYMFGTQYAAVAVSLIFVGLVTMQIFLPVFYKLQLTSTFEYLEVRFARSVRQFASILFTISLVLQLPIIIYGPALAFSQATRFPVHYVTPIMCTICIFYTAVGGLKAAVWTDTIQFTVTLVTLLTVLIVGIISVGGFGEVWRIADENGSLIFFDMDPNPFVRTSFWGISIGLTTSLIAQFSVHQSCIQKFLSVPTIWQAKKAICLTSIGLIVVKLVSVYTGMIIYAKYHDCDPISTERVEKPDQIIPYYVMDVAGNIHGLPGLFMAALVNSGMSAMSSTLNTTAGIIWEDFISPWVPESETKQHTATKLMRVTVVVLGVVCFALVFAVEHLGNIFALTTTMVGVTAGTVIAFYTLGVLAPWINSKGVIVGGVIGFVASTWVIVGAQIHKMNGNIRYEGLPLSTDNCSYPINETDWTRPTLPPIQPEDEPMIFFKLSFLHFSLFGAIVVVIFATITSIVTGGTNMDELNRDHFSPIVQRFLPRKKYAEVPMDAIYTADTISQEKERESQVIKD